jgi:hypothetical protein
MSLESLLDAAKRTLFTSSNVGRTWNRRIHRAQKDLTDEIIRCLEQGHHEFEVDGEPLVGGSMAQGTGLHGIRDYDILLRFTLPKESIDSIKMKCGRLKVCIAALPLQPSVLRRGCPLVHIPVTLHARPIPHAAAQFKFNGGPQASTVLKAVHKAAQAAKKKFRNLRVEKEPRQRSIRMYKPVKDGHGQTREIEFDIVPAFTSSELTKEEQEAARQLRLPQSENKKPRRVCSAYIRAVQVAILELNKGASEWEQGHKVRLSEHARRCLHSLPAFVACVERVPHSMLSPTQGHYDQTIFKWLEVNYKRPDVPLNNLPRRVLFNKALARGVMLNFLKISKQYPRWYRICELRSGPLARPPPKRAPRVLKTLKKAQPLLVASGPVNYELTNTVEELRAYRRVKKWCHNFDVVVRMIKAMAKMNRVSGWAEMTGVGITFPAM